MDTNVYDINYKCDFCDYPIIIMLEQCHHQFHFVFFEGSS